jgi:hypothetical protein
MLKARRFRVARPLVSTMSRVAHAALGLAVALVMVACASPPEPAPQTRMSTIGLGSRFVDAAPLYDLRHQADRGQTTVPATATAVWGVLDGIFDQLGIDVSFVDASAGTIGTENFRPRSIEGVRLSRWLDCGMGTVQANADAHQVTLSVFVQLLPAQNGTTVRTTVDAYSRDRSQSGGSIHCVSHGRLERRIPELVMERLGLEAVEVL